MLLVDYIFYLSIISFLILFIWIVLSILQFLLNRYYGRPRFRFAQIYYHNNLEQI